LASITLFIEGYMQPVGRYEYRKLVNVVKQQSFTAALREGTFTSVGLRTFFAGTDLPGSAIGPIFIYESVNDATNKQMGFRMTTASEGRLTVREETNEPVLQLSSGRAYNVENGKQLDGDLSFKSSDVAGAAGEIRFRARGDDERELTSLELFKNRKGEVFDGLSTDTNNAALHLRIGRALLLIILPFIAVPRLTIRGLHLLEKCVQNGPTASYLFRATNFPLSKEDQRKPPRPTLETRRSGSCLSLDYTFQRRFSLLGSRQSLVFLFLLVS